MPCIVACVAHTHSVRNCFSCIHRVSFVHYLGKFAVGIDCPLELKADAKSAPFDCARTQPGGVLTRRGRATDGGSTHTPPAWRSEGDTRLAMRSLHRPQRAGGRGVLKPGQTARPQSVQPEETKVQGNEVKREQTGEAVSESHQHGTKYAKHDSATGRIACSQSDHLPSLFLHTQRSGVDRWILFTERHRPLKICSLEQHCPLANKSYRKRICQ